MSICNPVGYGKPTTTQFFPALKIRSKTSWNLVLPAPLRHLLLTKRLLDTRDGRFDKNLPQVLEVSPAMEK